MGKETGIAWTDGTFNPWWGCVEVSPACDNCYAREWDARFGGEHWGKDAPRRFFGDKHWNELAHLALLVARLPRVEVDALELLFANQESREQAEARQPLPVARVVDRRSKADG